MSQSIPIMPSQSSALKRNYRFLEVKLGDGYTMRAGDGINNKVDEWTLTWDVLTQADFVAVMACLDSGSDGSPILWMPPTDSVTKKFCIKSDSPPTVQALAGNVWSVQATLTQVFDFG